MAGSSSQPLPAPTAPTPAMDSTDLKTENQVKTEEIQKSHEIWQTKAELHPNNDQNIATDLGAFILQLTRWSPSAEQTVALRCNSLRMVELVREHLSSNVLQEHWIHNTKEAVKLTTEVLSRLVKAHVPDPHVETLSMRQADLESQLTRAKFLQLQAREEAIARESRKKERRYNQKAMEAEDRWAKAQREHARLLMTAISKAAGPKAAPKAKKRSRTPPIKRRSEA